MNHAQIDILGEKIVDSFAAAAEPPQGLSWPRAEWWT